MDYNLGLKQGDELVLVKGFKFSMNIRPHTVKVVKEYPHFILIECFLNGLWGPGYRRTTINKAAIWCGDEIVQLKNNNKSLRSLVRIGGES